MAPNRTPNKRLANRFEFACKQRRPRSIASAVAETASCGRSDAAVASLPVFGKSAAVARTADLDDFKRATAHRALEMLPGRPIFTNSRGPDLNFFLRRHIRKILYARCAFTSSRHVRSPVSHHCHLLRFPIHPGYLARILLAAAEHLACQNIGFLGLRIFSAGLNQHVTSG